MIEAEGGASFKDLASATALLIPKSTLSFKAKEDRQASLGSLRVPRR